MSNIEQVIQNVLLQVADEGQLTGKRQLCCCENANHSWHYAMPLAVWFDVDHVFDCRLAGPRYRFPQHDRDSNQVLFAAAWVIV